MVKVVALNEKQNIFHSEVTPHTPLKGGLWLSEFVKVFTCKFLLLLTMVYGLSTTIDLQAKDIFQTGLEQFEAKQFQEAAASFSVYLKKNPDDVTALYNRGLCYYESNDLNNAITDFKKVVALNSQNVNAKENLSNALFKRANIAYEKDDLESALADFDAYLALNPEDDVAMFNKGIIYSKTERKKEAVDEFTKAITKNAKTEYFLNRALDYYVLKDLDKCLSDLNDVLKATPNDTTALWLRASISYEKDNYEAAKKDLEILVQLLPENAAVKDLYFINNISYFAEKNKYLVIALLMLILVGVYFSIKALVKKN